jgi:hypothetical protein
MLTEQHASVTEQHAFLDNAKYARWEAVWDDLRSKPHLVNCNPCDRWTALHQAAAAGEEDAVKLLLNEHGASTTVVSQGKLAVDVAKNDTIRAVITAATAGATSDKFATTARYFKFGDRKSWQQGLDGMLGKHVKRSIRRECERNAGGIYKDEFEYFVSKPAKVQ